MHENSYKTFLIKSLMNWAKLGVNWARYSADVARIFYMEEISLGNVNTDITNRKSWHRRLPFIRDHGRKLRAELGGDLLTEVDSPPKERNHKDNVTALSRAHLEVSGKTKYRD